MQLRIRYGDDAPDLINLGLPSEGVTGLSEDLIFPSMFMNGGTQQLIKAGRPCLINGGIYSPFDKRRFAFSEGFKRLNP